MKVVLLDPGLLNRHGHHFHTDLAIYHALEMRGLKPIVLGNRDVEPGIKSAMPVRPVFRATAYPDRDGFLQDGFRSTFDSFNQWVAEDLEATELEQLTEDDLIIVPTVRNIHLDGVFHWYTRLPEPRPRICLRLMFTPVLRTHPDDWDVAVALSKAQLQRWKTVPEDRLILVAETEELSDYFDRLCGLRASVFPLIVRYPAIDGRASANLGQDLPRRFAFVGEARKEKGAHLLPEAFKDLFRLHPEAHLTVQTSCLFDVNAGFVDELNQLSPRVSLLGDVLSAEAYDDAIESADVMLLPYDAEQYRLRTSLIFLEAVGAGKPVLVSPDTWMHRMLLDLGLPDICVEEFTSQGLFDALQRLLRHWPEVISKSAQAALELRRRHNPTRFVETVLDAASVTLQANPSQSEQRV